MRVLHISTRLILGGSQENTVLSCEGQSRLGHEVHLAFGPIYGPEGSLLPRVEAFNKRCATGEESTRDGAACRPIKTHVVPHMVRDLSPRTDYRCYRELRDLIRDVKPDVVHTHSSKAGILGRWAAWDEKVARIIHTIHGPPFMPLDGPPLRRLKTRVTNFAYTRAERVAARRCHRIVSVADAMTKLFLEKGIGRSEQYSTVYSGMETGPYLAIQPGQDRDSIRKALGLAPSDFVIGTIARLAEHKGHHDLLRALHERMAYDRSIKLLWVGDGWWAESLKANAARLGLEVGAQVVMTGLVTPDRIPGLVRAMDVLAHPSYREGLPRTVPQALLCGVCPVAYDVDGTGEVCRDKETGRLVKLGDEQALGHAIMWLKDHPRERAEMAQVGRERCRRLFSAERMVDELELVYADAGRR